VPGAEATVRVIECEGGPYDGKRIAVADDAVEVSVPIRRGSMLFVHLMPTKMPVGLYREDPLDRATFLWAGE
jgi:hypothetical protein